MSETCEIVRDLLPLYAEGMASGASAAIVEKHVKACAHCAKELSLMRASPAPQAAEALPLFSVRRTIKTQKTRARMLAALAVLLVTVCAFSLLTTPHYIRYTAELCSVTPAQNGVYIEIPGATSCRVERSIDPGTGASYASIEAWQSVLEQWTTKNASAVVLIKDAQCVYYSDNASGGELRQIYGDELTGGGIVALPRLALNYWFLLAAGTAFALGVLWLLLRKKKAGKVLGELFLLPVSYLLGSLLIMGFDCTTFMPVRDLLLILLCALAIYGILRIVRAMVFERCGHAK